MTGYTGFSSKTAERTGNYLALHCDVPGMPGAAITVELVGGTKGPVALDEDRTIVIRVADNTQSVKVTAATEGWDPVVREYALTDIVLNDS